MEAWKVVNVSGTWHGMKLREDEIQDHVKGHLGSGEIIILCRDLEDLEDHLDIEEHEIEITYRDIDDFIK